MFVMGFLSVRRIGTMLSWSKRWTSQAWSLSPGSSGDMQGEAGQDKGQGIEEEISGDSGWADLI